MTLNDHTFACKRIEIKQKDNEDFANEVQMLSALKHENILRLLYQTETKSHYFLLLEYCNGGDVARAIKVATQSSLKNNKVRGLIESVVRRITLHTVKALAYVHQNGIVHRDIKSQNVVFNLDPSDPDYKNFIDN